MSEFKFDDTDLVITEQEVNAYEKLVGEGKKFSDTEELAKGKLESDQFITKLESENEELRTEIDKRLAVEEAMNRMVEQSAKTPQKPIENEGGPKEEPVDIDAMLDKKLAERDTISTQKQNFESSVSLMKEAWGDEWQQELKTRSRQTGISVEELQGYASNNPTVLNTLLGLSPAVSPKPQVPNTIDTGKMPETTSGVQDYKYFQKLRKENLSHYNTAAVQLQMFKKAKELGDAFYN